MKIIPVQSLLQSRILIDRALSTRRKSRGITLLSRGGRKEKSSTRDFFAGSNSVSAARCCAANQITRNTAALGSTEGLVGDLYRPILSRISKNNCTRLRSRRITERKVECGSIKCARKEAEGSATRGHEERYTACAIFTLHSRAFSCSFFCCVYLFLFLFFPFLLRVTLLASTLLFRIRIHFLVLPRAFSPLFPIVEGVYIMVYSVLFECNKCKEVLLVGRLKLIHSLRRNRRGEWYMVR